MATALKLTKIATSTGTEAFWSLPSLAPRNGSFWDILSASPKGDSTADQTFFSNGQALQVTNYSGSPAVLKNT